MLNGPLGCVTLTATSLRCTHCTTIKKRNFRAHATARNQACYVKKAHEIRAKPPKRPSHNFCLSQTHTGYTCCCKNSHIIRLHKWRNYKKHINQSDSLGAIRLMMSKGPACFGFSFIRLKEYERAFFCHFAVANRVGGRVKSGARLGHAVSHVQACVVHAPRLADTLAALSHAV